MAGGWFGSTRRDRLPADWRERRFRVRLRAGGLCEWVEGGRRCRRPGSDCDHIIPGDNHRLSNLQWLCRPHHLAKSSREGNAAPRVRMARPVEEHPAFR